MAGRKERYFSGRITFLMPLSSSFEPGLPAAWDDMLEQIQRALAEALQATDERVQALSATSEPRGAGSVSEGLDASLAHASGSAGCEELATETEQTLAAAQAALDRWLTTAAQVGQKLADLATRAV